MVNTRCFRCRAVLLLAAAVLAGAAALRSAEYDEQYTLFLTGGVARPAWPQTPFAAGSVVAMQSGQAGLLAIARDLRRTDVHPPLYFWAVAVWRRAVGGGVLAARMFSVLCSLAALLAVGAMARSAGIPPALAMLFTLGCYGFAYTGSIARGFALAQVLNVAGVALLMRRRHIASGFALGAAAAANYLAVFVALASLARGAAGAELRSTGGKGSGILRPAAAPRVLRTSRWSAARRRTASPAGLLPGLCLFVSLDLCFFLAQHNARTGQFPPFHLPDSLQRLARYLAADFSGGLPRYASGPLQPLLETGLSLGLCACVMLVLVRWRHIPMAPLLAAAAAATPLGLLVLGAVYRTTPIELRYLAFTIPFAATLLAGAVASLPRRPRHVAIAMVLAVQAAAMAGLLTRPETMQPARATAAAAASLAGDGIVLLPGGNDGVGIVGAFASESPPNLRLLVVRPDETPQQILARIGPVRRVVLALLAQDAASRATVPLLQATFGTPCWQRLGRGFNVLALGRICPAQAPLHL